MAGLVSKAKIISALKNQIGFATGADITIDYEQFKSTMLRNEIIVSYSGLNNKWDAMKHWDITKSFTDDTITFDGVGVEQILEATQ